VSGQLHALVVLFQEDDSSVPLNKRLDGHQKQYGLFGLEIQTLTTPGIDIRLRGLPLNRLDNLEKTVITRSTQKLVIFVVIIIVMTIITMIMIVIIINMSHNSC